MGKLLVKKIPGWRDTMCFLGGTIQLENCRRQFS